MLKTKINMTMKIYMILRKIIIFNKIKFIIYMIDINKIHNNNQEKI